MVSMILSGDYSAARRHHSRPHRELAFDEDRQSGGRLHVPKRLLLSRHPAGGRLTAPVAPERCVVHLPCAPSPAGRVPAGLLG